VLQSPPLEAHNVLVVLHYPTDLQVLLTGGPQPNIFAPLGDCPWALYQLAQLTVAGRL